MKRALHVALGALLASPATAADLRIEVGGLRNVEGTVYAAVCTENEFLQPACAHFGRAPATEGVVTVTGVPPGTYAVQVVHDENDNQTLDRPGFLPTEGMGFSRDAPMRFGPPQWRDASFTLEEPGATVRLTMRYFQ
ncbi:DUF2141 domain-containing protein [Rubellimicrobium roseum]|uniref:DUF2141 domain-containing protein n=1 Tax=Rubellimicrobium roseum TaxID=687525 RepID=A0A5C4NIV9_9RHOB|nr:DUF2141 domain-containing protein [Rubellimicrobium roseum]TNC74764.1 DUF2141 domain-containing protein [Rubellimicrobium roseum]